MVPSSLPPPRFPRAPCLQPIFPCISPSSSCLLSALLSFKFPSFPMGAGCHPPSAHMTDWRPVPCCTWLSSQRPDAWWLSPPTCAAGDTWLGCGWRAYGTCPPDDLGFLKCFTVPGFDALDSPWCSHARLCLPPYLLPLSLYNITCPITLPTNGRVFSWLPRLPSPRRSPCPGLPDSLLNASRSPFRVPPPPHSVAMCVLVRSHPIGI